MKTLEDTDPMPFGQYADTPMQDVPARYLHWLYTEGTPSENVADYIRRNLDALKMEYPNGIWD